MEQDSMDQLFNSLLLDALHVPCYMLDLDQNYVAINQAAINKLNITKSKQKIIHKSLYDVLQKDLSKKLIHHHKKVIQTGQTDKFEISVESIEGQVNYYAATISPLYKDKRRIVGSVAQFLEITLGKHVEASMQRDATNKIFKRLEEIAQSIPVPS